MTTWSITDGVDTVNLTNMTLWDRTRAPREKEIATQGRNWSRVHHEGAGPLTIPLSCVLKGTLLAMEDAVRQMETWRTEGTLLTLTAPGETYYNGIAKLRIRLFSAAREVGKLTSRFVSMSLVQQDGE